MRTITCRFHSSLNESRSAIHWSFNADDGSFSITASQQSDSLRAHPSAIVLSQGNIDESHFLLAYAREKKTFVVLRPESEELLVEISDGIRRGSWAMHVMRTGESGFVTLSQHWANRWLPRMFSKVEGEVRTGSFLNASFAINGKYSGVDGSAQLHSKSDGPFPLAALAAVVIFAVSRVPDDYFNL